MSLKEFLKSAFDRFRSTDDITEAGRGFDFKSYDQEISQLFAQNGIMNVRQVGGTFQITDALRQSYKGGNHYAQNFDVATVALADHADGNSSAFMVGWRKDGQGYEIISLHNIGRPESLQSSSDYEQARIYAHMARKVLVGSAIELRSEKLEGFTPERYRSLNLSAVANTEIGLRAA